MVGKAFGFLHILYVAWICVLTVSKNVFFGADKTKSNGKG